MRLCLFSSDAEHEENLNAVFNWAGSTFQGGSVTLVWTCCFGTNSLKSHNGLTMTQAFVNFQESKEEVCVLVCMCIYTWGTGGFQRMFLSGAGVKPVVPVGLFFRRRTTPLGSSLSLITRFFSCQPTWLTGCEHTETRTQSISMCSIYTMYGQI